MNKKTGRSTPSPAASSNQLLRLQRVLAGAGLGSRRDCETLITEGRVEVDGKPCTELGTRVDPESQEIRVDGERIRGQKLQYFMLNKPEGVLSTNEDPDGRTRVIDLIKTDLRVYNVGRLDQSSEGLIIVTNDGDLAFRLTHPKFGVEKRYLVKCVGCPTLEQLQQLERGVYLAEGKAKVERVSIKKRQRTGAILEMVLTEGRNREIRRVLAAIGHKVTRLKRVAIGPLQLGDLAVGAHRRLNPDEVTALKQAAAGSAKRSSKPKASSGPARTLAHLKASDERTPASTPPSSGRGRRLDRTSPSPERGSKETKQPPRFGRAQAKAGSGRTARPERGSRDFTPRSSTADRPSRKFGAAKSGLEQRRSDKRSPGDRTPEKGGAEKRGSDRWRGTGAAGPRGTGSKSFGSKGLGGKSFGDKSFGGKGAARPEAPRRGPKRAQPPRGAQGKSPRGPAGKNRFRKGR
ncbi:MAG: pseudouridine synthase [Planctomycetota bacterium]